MRDGDKETERNIKEAGGRQSDMGAVMWLDR